MRRLFFTIVVMLMVFILQAFAVSPSLAQEAEPEGLVTEFLFHLHADIGPAQAIGPRVIFPLMGGTFEGPALNGEVMNPGADWSYTTPDGLFFLDGRMTFQTDDGELIYVHLTGVRYVSPEQGERMAAGEAVDPTELYWRIVMYFETTSEDLTWMNYTIALGTGKAFGFSAEGALEWVEFDVYALR